MSKEEKSIYDKIYYQKPEVKIKKKARARALIRLSHSYPAYFKKLYEEELKKQEKGK